MVRYGVRRAGCLALSGCLGLAASAQTLPKKPRADTPVVSEILAVQVLLDRAGFSPGEIDGKAGPNVERALAAYQRAHGLTVEPALDAAWRRLTPETHQPPLVEYEVTAEDVRGPFVERIPADLVEQSRLPALGYTSPLEAIAERFHTSPALLKTLNPGLSIPRAGDRLRVPNVEPFEVSSLQSAVAGTVAGRSAPTIVVRKATSALTLEDADGRVILHAPVTVGSERDPLPTGTWKVTTVQRNPKFHYNPALFWDADPKHSKATIPPGPNNPVGVVWIDLSKEHYGIHGTPEPSRVGHTQSHGCIRLTNWDAARVAARTAPGTRVVFE